MLKTTTFALSAALFGATAVVAEDAMMADTNIVEAAIATPELSTLVTAVTAAGLVDTLAGAGPFTVFAPTDAAFGKISADSIAALLEPAAQGQLTEILTCHVVAGEVFAGDLVGLIEASGGMASVETLGGCTLTAMIDGGDVKITDENGRISTVVATDLDQTNGVVHVIDTVIVPAGQAG